MSESRCNPWRLTVAPMMDWTDRHCRYFHRLLSPNARLYTEMVTAGAVIHGDRDRLIGFDSAEQPVAVQLGGSSPSDLAQAARICEERGYAEVNLNVGCPSDRVQNGRFGACLMAEPELVGDCVAAMQAAVSIPITVKCRIGIDDQDDDADLLEFVQTVSGAGCEVFIIHARKAWLSGLSPKENRDVPPLNYPRVYRLKTEFPDLTVIVNGGITETSAVDDHLQATDGVMIGRAAYHDPYFLASLDNHLFGTPLPDRENYLRAYRPYIESQLANGVWLKHMTRHILGLYQGCPGARQWRRHLSENAHARGADWTVVDAAASHPARFAA